MEIVAGEIARIYSISPLELPEAGLYLLQLQEGITGAPFYAGEFTGARASVRLTDSGGNPFDGAAIITRDDAELAEWIAICDAVLRHRLPGEDQVQPLVREGIEKREQEQRVRHSILGRTAVDFSLLEETD